MLNLLSVEEVERVFDPGAYLGSTDAFIDHALASYREARAFGDVTYIFTPMVRVSLIERYLSGEFCEAPRLGERDPTLRSG